MSFELADNINHHKAIVSHYLDKKKENMRAFMITYTIGYLNFSKALYNVVTNIKLMQLVFYKQSGLGLPKLTYMRLLMVDPL